MGRDTEATLVWEISGDTFAGDTVGSILALLVRPDEGGVAAQNTDKVDSANEDASFTAFNATLQHKRHIVGAHEVLAEFGQGDINSDVLAYRYDG